MRWRIPIFIGAAIAGLILGILMPIKAGDQPEKLAPPKPRLSEKEIIEILDVLKLWKAAKELSLSSEQLTSFIPKFNRYEELKREYYRSRRDIVSEIRKLVEKGGLDQAERAKLEELMAKLGELDDKFYSDIREAFRSMTEGLDALQKAKLIVFLESYRRDIRQILMHLRELGERR